MKYVLVDKYDNIVTTKELASNIGVSGARTYFMKIKNLDEKLFDSIWRVMTKEKYNQISESYSRKPSSFTEFGDWLDVEKS